MAFVMEVPLDNGETILVEVTGQVQGVVPAGKARDVIGKLPEALSEGLDRVQRFSSEVLERMRDAAEPPDVLAVEFGLKFSAKTGIVVAESSGEAHLKVTAEWHRNGAERQVAPAD
ncbi:CU044_2847 family protein [Actinomadura welshii]|uniref:CU044_2847 family protein n=1 Tax=Actinomadura welshii TaxID=3103817 RepID=UPI0003ACDBF8|nr:CU044_2847 family protein [Actinomadura madurae]